MSYRDNVIDTKEYKGYTIEVQYDDSSGQDSPRDWDNGTTLCLTHRRYSLPNEGNIPFDSLDSMEEVVSYVKENFDVVGEVYPVSMYDHGGTMYYLGSPRDPWDSGYVGVIFATKQGQELCGYDTENIEAICKSDLDIFTQWANGYVYGFVVTDPDGEMVDDGSLWGMYDDSGGFSYVYGEAEARIDYEIEHRAKQKIKDDAYAMAYVTCGL